MSFTLFSATGCSRCKMVKSFLESQNIEFCEQDIHKEGKEEFKIFYRKNRPQIFRGKDGVEFPLLFTGKEIYQGVGIILGFLHDNALVNKFVTRNQLGPGWVSGLNISSASPELGNQFIKTLEFLKAQGLKTEITTRGQNPGLLAKIISKNLADRLEFHLMGPADLYEDITGQALEEEELIQSLALLNPALDYKIILAVSGFKPKDEASRFLSCQEAGRAAALVEQATGSKKHCFLIRPVTPEPKLNLAPLTGPDLFKYRTAARRYMVMTEIEK